MYMYNTTFCLNYWKQEEGQQCQNTSFKDYQFVPKRSQMCVMAPAAWGGGDDGKQKELNTEERLESKPWGGV